VKVFFANSAVNRRVRKVGLLIRSQGLCGSDCGVSGAANEPAALETWSAGNEMK